MSLRSFLQDHPGPLVQAWRLTEVSLRLMRGGFRRLGLERSSRSLALVEEPLKRLLFGCRMCGQCVLHYTGMTCPMTCPKELRNGPCGGVCLDGKCEVDETMDCVWVKAVERVARTRYAEEIHRLNPALDWRLEGMSSWVTFALERDRLASQEHGGRQSATDVVGPS
jgi:hypothetical protein